jgi:predicted outer membrane repeat protein
MNFRFRMKVNHLTHRFLVMPHRFYLFGACLLIASFSSITFASDSLDDANLLSSDIVLRLANGENVEAHRISSTDLGGGDFSWTGQLMKASAGFVTFAKVDNMVSASIHFSSGRAYSLRGQGRQPKIKQVISKKRPCGGCLIKKDLPSDPRRHRRTKTWRNGDGNLIDLLIVYPSSVATAAGGLSLLKADAVKAVADANLCYRNSRVNLQLRLVHFSEVNYNQTGNLETDLARLENPNDGYMDNVHDLRDQYGADLVAMLATESSSGGLANTMMYPSLDFASQGFSVSVWDQIGAPSYTLAHELGHNMGCLHNREDSSGVDDGYEFRSFSYGKRWLSGNPGYATVMSYDTEPTSTFPNTIPFFSNPDVFYLETATGNVGSENNAQVLKFTGPYVANFRSAVVQAIVPSLLSVAIQEGNSTSLGVRLAVKPSSPLSVNISLVAGGDADLMVTSSSSMTFDSTNWNLPHPLQISALLDSDIVNGIATINLSASGVSSSTVLVTELDSGTTTTTSHLIAGVSTNSLGSGISGVTLTFSNGGGSVITDVNGTFRHQVDGGWSGIITPSKTGHTFLPATTLVTSLSGDSVAHNFIASRPSILYVDLDASGAGDGTSWANAYTDLAVALRSTHPFSEVWVAEGIYKPGTARPAAFLLPPGIPVYGGFTGTETSLNQRDHSANPTILSGEIGDPNVSGDNCYHVVIPTTNTTLDGFTISNGNASENYSDDRGKGGAIWAEYSVFTIKNCIFSSNFANQKGGAIFLNESNATLENCTFNGNTTGSTGDGGAVDLNSSTLALTACNFVSNHSYFYGGAINSLDSNITLNLSYFATNQSLNSNGGGAIRLKGGSIAGSFNSFIANKGTHEGGAILWEETTGSLSDSNFTSNQNLSWNGGGGIYFKNASPTILRCSFTGNITNANNYGGAIHLNNASPTISNCIFTSNAAASNSGGAISIDSTSLPVLSVNEFRYNSANDYGGAIYVSGGQNLQATNNLFLGNYSNSGGAVSAWGSTSLTFTNCRFIGNEANMSSSSSGGMAMLANGTISTSFVNCVISGNKANYRSGVLQADGTTRFVNCSLYGNVAQEGGVTLLFTGETIEIENSIIWNNSANTVPDIYKNTGIARINNSIFLSTQSSGLPSGTGNLSADPMFSNADGTDNVVGTEDDDLRLQASSPAIDQASLSASGYISSDLLGKTRYGSGPDLGAYEYRINSAPVLTNSIEAGELSVTSSDGNVSVVTLAVSDADGDAVSFSLGDSGDDSLFVIDATTGAVQFRTPPNFYSPADSNSDNIYTLTVFYTDSEAPANSVALRITVNDSGSNTPIYVNLVKQTEGDGAVSDTGDGTYELNDTAFITATPGTSYAFSNWTGDANGSENPLTLTMEGNKTIVAVFNKINSTPQLTHTLTENSFSISLTENTTVAIDLNASDADGDTVTFALSGTDSALFDLNSSTGILRFLISPDYEKPDDADLNRAYDLLVTISDGINTSSATLIISILDDTSELPNSYTLTVSVEGLGEVSTSIGDLTSSSASFLYAVDSNITLVATPFSGYFFTKWKEDANSSFTDISVTMNDNRNIIAVFSKLNVAPRLLNNLTAGTVRENVIENNRTVLAFNGEDEDGDIITFSLQEEGDFQLFDLNTTSGLLTFNVSPDFELPTDADADNIYQVFVTLSDGKLSSSPTTVLISVLDHAENTWNYADNLGDDWRNFAWFGNYYDTYTGWIYHEYHGWIYRESENTDTNSIWLYDPLLGWLWTSSYIYPNLYQSELSEWIYYEETSISPRRFYRYSGYAWQDIN